MAILTVMIMPSTAMIMTRTTITIIMTMTAETGRQGMRIARRSLIKFAGGAIAAPALARFAAGQAQIVLKLHHFFSPLSSVHAKFLVPWAQKIGAASEGRIRIDLFGAMQLGGVPSELYDQARDGVADIVWTQPGMTPGRFPLVETFELPFVAGKRALVNARAVQEFADANLKEEFRAVQPLCVCAHDHGLIHANRAVAALDDLQDLKLRPSTRMDVEALKALGASVAPVPISQVGEAFSQKRLDGCVLPWDDAAAVKVHELVRFHAEIANTPTFSTATSILAMNRAKYAGLPPDLKKVIDENSGDAAATMVGRMWDDQAANVEDMVRKRGNTVSAIAAEQAERWRKATEPVIEAWIKQVRIRSIDGAKMVETVRALVSKYEAMPAASARTGSTPAAAPAPTCATWCPSP
jgi:TRAP-type transport system periplasmic protein